MGFIHKVSKKYFSTRIISGCLAIAPFSLEAVVLNFVESFDSGTAGLSFNGGITVSNELGGTGGVSDGFLSLRTSSPLRFGARINGSNTAFTGDYAAAGVQAVRFSILDLDSEDSAIIRVGFGVRQSNFWVSNFGIDPVFGEDWQEVLIPLDDFSNWTSIQGSGGQANFDAAIQGSETFQFRADSTVDGSQPDSITASVGIDDVAFVGVPEPTTAFLIALTGFIGLRRRR